MYSKLLYLQKRPLELRNTHTSDLRRASLFMPIINLAEAHNSTHAPIILRASVAETERELSRTCCLVTETIISMNTAMNFNLASSVRFREEMYFLIFTF